MATTMTPITRILTASMLSLALPFAAQEASQEIQDTDRVTE